MRLTLNPRSVTDIEGVKDVALALKAAKKPSGKRNGNGSKKRTEGDSVEELGPIVTGAPRYCTSVRTAVHVMALSWSSINTTESFDLFFVFLIYVTPGVALCAFKKPQP